jgi:proteasome lid subunit RPN8/RPN11
MAPEVRDEMFAHALAGLPDEACGMFSAHNGVELVDVFHPMRNAAASAMKFALDPQQMLDVEAEVDETGRSLVGVMHSHTHTSPYPSPTDVADIGRFDPFGTFSHVIVSLRDAEPVLRSFRIVGGVVTEEPVVVFGGEPVVHDQAGAVAAVSRLPRRPVGD